MSQEQILVVDDERAIRDILDHHLCAEGFQVTTAEDGPSALEVLKSEPIQVLVTDLRLPGMGGMELLTQAWQINPHLPGIVMTGYPTVEVAIQAMKAGAFDFILKPVQVEALTLSVKKAVEFLRLRQENVYLRKTLDQRVHLGQLVGTSEAMGRLRALITQVADTDSTVLIQGESGTGKEVVARLLHQMSSRAEGPWVPINCAAIPETLLESELFGHEKGAFSGALTVRQGRFELAHGGTLFLDEIGDMPLPLQAKLLRALQERAFERVGGTKTIRVNLRIIAATNQDLEQAVQERRFRADLYYRLNVIPLTVPPLRERISDVPLLVTHFLRQFNETNQTSVAGFTGEAMAALMRYHWPGNIRELENLIERLVILKRSGTIDLSELPDKIRERPLGSISTDHAPPIGLLSSGTGIDLVQELDRYETSLILEALRQAGGVTSKAAQLLGLNRTTLVEKLKRKGLGSKSHVDSLTRPAGAQDRLGAGVP
jgi:DNA-binding NtrC family response regulator